MAGSSGADDAILGLHALPRALRACGDKATGECGACRGDVQRAAAVASPMIDRMVTLVLLPGMDGSGELFEPLLLALHGRIDSVVVRYPDDDTAGYDDLAKRAAAVLPHDAPFILLGESFSGPIAVTLAAARPTGLVGLILCCTFVRNPRPAFGGLRALVGRLPAIAPPLACMHRLLMGRFSTPALRAAFRRSMAQVRPSTLRTRLQAVLGVDAGAQLVAVDVPILDLRASHDRVVPASAGAHVHRIRPDARAVLLEGPHFLLQANPAAAAEAVLRFADESIRARQ